MLELRNRTPFRVELFPAWDREGREVVLLVVKASFNLNPTGEVALSDEQVPIQYSDEFYGAPGQSSVRYESDLALFKPRADIIVNGTAYASGGRRVKTLVVGVRVGSLSKNLLIYGDRIWRRGILGLSPTSPESFSEMPLVYERSFGGNDTSKKNYSKHEFDNRNPVGRGFHVHYTGVKGCPLPNIELPQEPIRHWKDKPTPAGFGFIARNWYPRTKFIGTYDEAWQAIEMPFLPLDFDYRHFQAASVGMTIPYPQGGEPVVLDNLMKDEHYAFFLPRVQVPVNLYYNRGEDEACPVVDTILIEPDVLRLLLTLRLRIPCQGDAFRLREVVVGEMSTA